MDEVLRCFKTCVDSARQQFKLQLHELNASFDFDNFMADASMRQHAPKELAAKALAEVCDCSSQQVRKTICVGVAEFLQKQYGRPADSVMEQLLKDLCQTMRQVASLDNCWRVKQFLVWADSWHP